MGMLGNGDKDDAWLGGNQNGREEAFNEVLEKVEQLRIMHGAFSIDSSQSNAMRHYHGVKKHAFQEFKDWLTKQLNEST